MQMFINCFPSSKHLIAAQLETVPVSLPCFICAMFLITKANMMVCYFKFIH